MRNDALLRNQSEAALFLSINHDMQVFPEGPGIGLVAM